MTRDERFISERLPKSNKCHPDWILTGVSGGANPLWLTEWLLQVKPGDSLIIHILSGKVLILEKPKSYRKAIRGLMRNGYGKDYLRKERDRWE